MPGNGAHGQGDRDDDSAMAQRKQGSAQARQTRPHTRVEARHAVDGGHMVSIEDMPRTQREHQQAQGGPFTGEVDLHGKKSIPIVLTDASIFCASPLCDRTSVASPGPIELLKYSILRRDA
jgi:hypothetical protein